MFMNETRRAFVTPPICGLQVCNVMGCASVFSLCDETEDCALTTNEGSKDTAPIMTSFAKIIDKKN